MNIVFAADAESVTYHSDNNVEGELRKVSKTSTDKPFILLGKMVSELQDKVHLGSALVSIIGVDLDASKS